MGSIFKITVLLFISNCSFSQDSISVLFIGNSYTYGNDLPNLVSQFATAQGKEITVSSQTQGGATFDTHSGNMATYTKIHEKPWDYVILQGQSQEPSFPDNQVNSFSIPPAIRISDSIYSSKFCTELMLFMTWGYINGDPQWQPISTYEGMQSRLRNAYMRIADSCQASVSPVGMAWKHIRETHPEINLYAADGSHPSLEGSYLATCTFYAALFRESPVGCTFTAGLSPEIAEHLQNSAAITVLDSLDHWYLRSPENHTIADFDYVVNGNEVTTTNLSRKAQSYVWSFGDGTNSIEENPVHNYAETAIYTISLEATSECNNDEINETIYLGDLELIKLENLGFRLRTISNGEFELIPSNSASTELQLIDLHGTMGIISKGENGYFQVDLRNKPAGIYILTIDNESIKVVKN